MSNPMFEASVRLQLDIADFEKQAQQSVQRVLNGIEQQTDAAIRAAQQRAAQVTTSVQQRAAQPPVATAAVTQAGTPAVPVPVELIPPTSIPEIDVPPVPVELVVEPPSTVPEVEAPPVHLPSTVDPPQDLGAVNEALNASLGQGVTIPVEVETPVVPPVATPPPVIQPVETETPVVPPAEPPPPVIQPVEVETPVVPTIPQPPPVEVPVELTDLQAEIESASSQLEALKRQGEDARRELESVGDESIPASRFVELRERLAEVRVETEAVRDRLREAGEAAQNFRPVDVGVPDAVQQAAERAQALATQPIDFTLQANVEEFERQTTEAFDNALRLAERNADEAGQLAEQAANEAADAFERVSLAGVDRSSAIAEANLTAAVARQAEVAKAAAQDVVDQLQGAIADASLRPAQDLQLLADTAATQARTAGLLGDEATSAAKALEAAVLQQLSAAETFSFQQRTLLADAAAASGDIRDNLVAKAQEMGAAAEEARAAADRLQREGFAPEGGRGPGQQRGGFLDAVRSLASQRTGGATGLLGGAFRFGIAGFAATAAFQTFNELQNAIRATGDEAFTTEGKIRNLGAELLSGNLIGGIRALTAAKPATLVGGLEELLAQRKAAADATVISLEEVLIAQRQLGADETTTAALDSVTSGLDREILAATGASDALQNLLLTQVEAGAISGEQAVAIAEATVQMEKFTDETNVAAEAQRQFAIAVARSGSEAARFGREGGLEGRGPGQLGTQGALAGTGQPGQVVGQQRTGIPRPIVTQPFPNALFQAVDPQVAAQIKNSLAERLRNEEDELRQKLKIARNARETAKSAFDAAKERAREAQITNGAVEQYRDLVLATTALGNAAQAVKDQAARSAAAIQDASNTLANARIANIEDPTAQAAATVEQREREVTQARLRWVKAVEDFGKGSTEAILAYNEIKIAQEAVISAQQAANQTAKTIAEQEKEKAEATRQSRLNAEQQALENDIAAAALTKRKSDDKKAFDAAIAYWRNLASEAGTSEEREAAQAQVLDLRERRAAALAGSAATGEDVELLRIQNRLAAAGLTDRISDDKRFTRQLIAYWQEKVNSLRGEAVEQEKARAQLINARLALKRLQEQQGESPEVFAQSLFQRAVDEFKRFGSNIAATPQGILAPQDARGFFAGALGGGFGINTVESMQAAQLSETQTTNVLLTQIAKNTSFTQKIVTNTDPPRRRAPIAPEDGRVNNELGANVMRGGL